MPRPGTKKFNRVKYPKSYSSYKKKQNKNSLKKYIMKVSKAVDQNNKSRKSALNTLVAYSSPQALSGSWAQLATVTASGKCNLISQGDGPQQRDGNTCMQSGFKLRMAFLTSGDSPQNVRVVVVENKSNLFGSAGDFPPDFNSPWPEHTSSLVNVLYDRIITTSNQRDDTGGLAREFYLIKYFKLKRSLDFEDHTAESLRTKDIRVYVIGNPLVGGTDPMDVSGNSTVYFTDN